MTARAARIVLAALLLAGSAPAEEDAAGEQEAAGWLPRFSSGGLSRAERDQPAIFVRLREGGHLQVKDRGEWKDATLDSLGVSLRRAKDWFVLRARRRGESGMDALPLGGEASKLFVSIEAAPDTPWQHIQWLMTIAAEQKYYKLEMRAGERRMLVFLPTDRGIFPFPKEGPREIRVDVYVAAAAWEDAPWAGGTVRRPAQVVYRLGETESNTLKDLVPSIRKGLAAAEDAEEEVVVRGEIKADHAVPWARVFDVMEAYLDEDLGASVSLFGTLLPPSKVREAARLPYPEDPD